MNKNLMEKILNNSMFMEIGAQEANGQQKPVYEIVYQNEDRKKYMVKSCWTEHMSRKTGACASYLSLSSACMGWMVSYERLPRLCPY